MPRSEKFLKGVAEMSTVKRMVSGGLMLVAQLTFYDEDSDTHHGYAIRSRSMDAGDDEVEFRKFTGARNYHRHKDLRRAGDSSVDFMWVECGDPAEEELLRIATENARGHLNAPPRPDVPVEVSEDSEAESEADRAARKAAKKAERRGK